MLLGELVILPEIDDVLRAGGGGVREVVVDGAGALPGLGIVAEDIDAGGVEELGRDDVALERAAEIADGPGGDGGIELGGARVVDDDQVAVDVAGLGEIALALKRGRNGSEKGSRLALAQAFVGGE